jgi:adenylate cyclase class 2
MATEREAKFRVREHDSVRRALTAAGARRVGVVFERNRVLDRTDGELRLRGSALRLRTCDVLDGPPHPPLLTFKGPAGPSRFKAREELETEVSNTEATLAILLALGFAESVYYEKRRESWLLADCKIELDELPELGFFVEIEGCSDHTIEDVGSRLGLSEFEHIAEGYLALIAEHCRKLGRKKLHIAF